MRLLARSDSGPWVCSLSAAAATTGTRRQTSITRAASESRSRRWAKRFAVHSAGWTRRVETAAFIGDLDQERPGRECQPHPADRRPRVPPHIGERFAHDLIHHLALRTGQHGLRSVARYLDPD